MNVARACAELGREMVRLDRGAIDWPRAFRNATGVVVPLVFGALTGRLLTGFGISIGALIVSFSDFGGPYRLRAFRLVLASVLGALSATVGAATGNLELLAVALVVLWAFAGGLVMALGVAAGQVGLTGILLLVIFSGYPAPVSHAISQGVLVLAGGLLQTALAVGAWPVRRHGPERAVLATVFRGLAGLAREPVDPDSIPPLTVEISAASTALAGFGRDRSAAAEVYRSLLDEAERIRLELVSLHAVQPDHVMTAQVDAIRSGAAGLLEAVSAVLDREGPPVRTAESLTSIQRALERVRTHAGATGDVATHRILVHLDALAGQLRAVVELAEEGSASERVGSAPAGVRLRDTIRGSLDILRANLTLGSTSFRHALRLAVCLLLASYLARRLGVARVYWVPLTAAIVLRPDFAATFTRGVGRILGTVVGLGLATGLVFTPVWNLPGRIALIALFAVLVRAIGPANFSVAAVGVTSLVVILLSFVGATPQSTAATRAVDTVLGGGVALLLYALWPTWERSQTPVLVARMLDSYRGYFDAVMAGYLQPERLDRRALSAARLASRLARSNVESSIARLPLEPVARGERLDRLDGVLAASHRFAQSAMTLEAGLAHAGSAPLPAETGRFVQEVDRALDTLASAAHDPRAPVGSFPDLRATQSRLVAGTARATPTGELLATQSDRITNSVNTVAHLLGAGGGGDEPAQ